MSVRNNNAATQVDIYQPGSESKNGLWTYSVFLNDSWQLHRRLTVNAGIRFDRHSAYLPDQVGPGGQSFARRRHRDLQQLGPAPGRQLRSDGRRQDRCQGELRPVLALPGADLASGLNPNATMWFERYGWTDRNGNGIFDTGEQGAAARAGGRAWTVFDENLENTHVNQFTAYVERELVSNFGVPTGFVWNGRRQVRGQINVNRPLEAYTVAADLRRPRA